MLKSSEQILQRQKTTLESAFSLLSWIPVAATAITVPAVLSRTEVNSVSLILAVLAITMSLARLSLWLQKRPISNRYLAATIILMICFSGIGYYGYGSAAAAVQAGFVALVAGNLIASEVRNRAIVTISACALFFAVGIHNSNGMITVAPTENWYDLIAGNQRLTALGSSLVALYLIYRFLVSFQIANSQMLALLKQNADEVSTAETSAEVLSNLYKGIPGAVIELDENDRIVTLSRDAEKFLDLKPSSTPHYAETRLIRVSDIEFALNGANSKNVKAAITVDVPWSNQAHQLEISSSYDASLHKHKIITFTPIEDTNYEPGKFTAQELHEIAASGSYETLHLVAFSIDLFKIKTRYQPISDAQQLARELQADYPVILEVTRSDIAICAVVSKDFNTIKKAIELIRERQDVVLTQNLESPVGCIIGILGREAPESYIVKSQLAMEIGREKGGTPLVEYDEDLYRDWDPSIRAIMVKALENQDIKLEPNKAKKMRSDLNDIISMRIQWHNRPDIVQPEHLSLYQWLSKYDLNEKLPSIEPSKAVEISNELLASSIATKVIFELPDELTADFEQLRYICDLIAEKPESASRTLLVIREETAAKFSPEQWQELDKQNNRGVGFALGDIGTGDSDMSLLSNPIFELLCINQQLASRGLMSDRNRIILQNLLSLSKKLRKPTLVNAPASDTATLLSLGADYVVEVEN